MGASSSSAYWKPRSEQIQVYTKKITCYYETKKDNIRLVKDVEVPIEKAIQVLNHKNLFSDITLILDIDLTLGEAILISRTDDPKKVKLLDDVFDLDHIHQLVQHQKIEWFHDGSCCYFIRPNFHSFIHFCLNNFKEVIIWTNGVQKHADSMVNLIYKISGKKIRGYGRDYSTGQNYIKCINKLGLDLDPSKIWMVDDDHRHFCNFEHSQDEKFHVNPTIKFFHTPEFSISYFKEIMKRGFPNWHGNWTYHQDPIDLYDDWFLFLIYNWYYMKENNIELVEFVRKENKFRY
jgi:hypothetical protein